MPSCQIHHDCCLALPTPMPCVYCQQGTSHRKAPLRTDNVGRASAPALTNRTAGPLPTAPFSLPLYISLPRPSVAEILASCGPGQASLGKDPSTSLHGRQAGLSASLFGLTGPSPSGGQFICTSPTYSTSIVASGQLPPGPSPHAVLSQQPQ